jgi:hypothetical protein
MYLARLTALFWIVIKTIITLDLWAFAMILPTFKRTAVQCASFRIFHNTKNWSSLFLGQPGSLLTLNGQNRVVCDCLQGPMRQTRAKKNILQYTLQHHATIDCTNPMIYGTSHARTIPIKTSFTPILCF